MPLDIFFLARFALAWELYDINSKLHTNTVTTPLSISAMTGRIIKELKKPQAASGKKVRSRAVSPTYITMHSPIGTK